MLKDYRPYIDRTVLAVAQRESSTYLVRGKLVTVGSGTCPVDLTFNPAEMEIINCGLTVHGDRVIKDTQIAFSESDLVSLALLE